MDASIWATTLGGWRAAAMVRQQVRLIGDCLGLDDRAQLALATAAGLVASAVPAGSGRAEFAVRAVGDGRLQLEVAIIDDRPGQPAALGLGGARRLVDQAAIEPTAGGGMRIRLGKLLPERTAAPDAQALAAIQAAAAATPAVPPEAALVVQDLGLAEALDTLEGAHEQTAERLSRVRALAARLLETLGHEFRTPLNSICALARLLLEGSDGPLSPGQEKQVGFMLAAAESVSDLVDDLLELGRIDAGEPAIPRSWRELRDDAPAAGAGGALLIVEDRPEDLRLYEGFLRGSGYRIVGARTLAEAELAVTSMAPRAIVVDAGPIDDALRRFVAGRQAGAPPVLLAATPEEADAAAAVGADRVLVKPIDGDRLLAVLAEVAPPAAVATAGRARILIIDDDEAWRFALRQRIPAGLGQVIEAADGEAGLRQLLADPPDVAFVDLMMPGMSGFDVIRAAAADERAARVPVVVVTSSLPNAAERASLAGTVAILRKDAMSQGSVVAALEQALGRWPADRG